MIINNLLDNSQVRYKHANYIIYLGFFFIFSSHFVAEWSFGLELNGIQVMVLKPTEGMNRNICVDFC